MNAFSPPSLRGLADSRAFTLVELLTVIAIMAIIAGLLVTSFSTVKGGTDVAAATYSMAGALEQARAYAMANNTYVYVGFEEVDSSLSPSAVPQNPATGAAGGRIAVVIMAAKDGTDDVADWATDNQNGQDLLIVSPLMQFNNVHMVTSSGGLPDAGNMTRPVIGSSGVQLGNVTQSATPLTWPLGSTTGAAQYTFNQVIQFDPQGIARVPLSSSNPVLSYIEIGLQQTHGNYVPPPPGDATGAIAAVQIDGVSGAAQVYRP